MNKKGFTLIELLAVIVILAIIALIATPVVLNIIEDSKESSAKDSAMVIAKSAETYYMSQTTLEGNEVTEIDLKDDTLNYKGEKPEKGYVTFDDKGNAYLKMYMNGYCVISDYDNTVTSTKTDSDECVLPTEVSLFPLKDGQIVYFNPVTNSFCEDYNATTNSKNGFRGTETNGCMLWHAFLDTEDAETIRLLLDHSTSTNMMSWTNTKTEIANAKDKNLYGWHAEVYPTARLISAEEVNQIAPDSAGTWSATASNNFGYYFHTGTTSYYRGEAGTNKYAWLFDNTNVCHVYGCNVTQNSHMGYWTSTEKNSTNSWHVGNNGDLAPLLKTNTNSAGAVRPVIELPKSKFKDENWKPFTYTLTFKDGDEVVSTKEVEYKDDYGTFPTLTKDGYELVWKISGVAVSSESLVKVMNDHEAVAEWRKPTYLAKLYFNPVTNSACRESDYNAQTNSANGFRGTTDNGCMLWYAYKEDNGNYLLILDHNTTTKEVYWDVAQTEIANAKDNNLYGWHSDVRSTIRMISAEEVTEVAPNQSGTWTTSGIWYYLHTGSTSNKDLARGASKYYWLFDNLTNCTQYGCSVEINGQDGYWTSSVEVVESESEEETETDPAVWYIRYNGSLFANRTAEGIRPVISVPKTKFTN